MLETPARLLTVAAAGALHIGLGARADDTGESVVISGDNTDPHESLAVGCLPGNTKFRVIRPDGNSVTIDYNDPDDKLDDAYLKIRMGEVGIHYKSHLDHDLNCSSYFLDPRALIDDPNWSGDLDDYAYATMRGSGIDGQFPGNGIELSMTPVAHIGAEPCTKYWDVRIPIHEFTDHHPYHADEMNLLYGHPDGLDEDKAHWAAYMECHIGGFDYESDSLNINYKRTDFNLIMSINYDFQRMEYVDLTADGAITVKAEERPQADATDKAHINHEEMYTMALSVEEKDGEIDTVLRDGETWELHWDFDRTLLKFLHVERLENLRVDWWWQDESGFYNLGYNKHGLEGYTYYDYEYDTDPGPLCWSNVEDITKPNLVFPTGSWNIDEWFVDVMFPIEMYRDSEKQRALTGDGTLEVKITMTSTLSILNTSEPAYIEAHAAAGGGPVLWTVGQSSDVVDSSGAGESSAAEESSGAGESSAAEESSGAGESSAAEESSGAGESSPAEQPSGGDGSGDGSRRRRREATQEQQSAINGASVKTSQTFKINVETSANQLSGDKEAPKPQTNFVVPSDAPRVGAASVAMVAAVGALRAAGQL